MQEEEVGKNKILNINGLAVCTDAIIKEENYKKVIITKNGKFTVYSLFFDSNRFSTLNSLSKEDELELETESKLSKMVDFCIKILRKNFISSNELRQKLNKKFNDEELTNEVIELLIKNKILDDKKYVFIAKSLLDEAMYGKYFIIDYFKKKKISNEIIATLTFDEEKEVEKAFKFFQSIKNIYVFTNTLKAKKKIGQELLSRGFELNIISSLVDNLKTDHENEQKLLEKDAIKLKNKFSKKYSGLVLQNKIITGLIKIGYSYKEITNYLNNGGISND